MSEQENYDSLVVVSFGGPEGPDDVLPFLENVLRGKNVPRARLQEVAEHYRHFGGVSPINRQNRDLIAALKTEFASREIRLPIYFGNRNWHPLLPDTLGTMQKDGVRKALAFFTSAYSSYSGCRQYRENVAEAQQALGTAAPEVHKLRMFFNHPKFIAAAADRVQMELDQIAPDKRAATRLLFTAHSIPAAMAENCNYAKQLTEASRLVAGQLGDYRWDLVYQSRSGPPSQRWLEPDVCDVIETLPADGVENLVIMPIGFLSDHMEVLFDLDVEAKEACEKRGIEMKRAGSVGVHPRFVSMIADLVEERVNGSAKAAIGSLPASHDVCPANCCLPGTGSPRPAAV